MQGLRDAVSNEGAVSERMRLSHITEERKRLEKMRAKTALADKKRQLEHNKIEISHRETELRRINVEFAHAERNVEAMKHEMKDLDDKVHHLKTVYADMLTHIEKEKALLANRKKESDHEANQMQLIEKEMRALESRLDHARETVRHIGLEVTEFETKIAHMSNDADKAQVDAMKIASQKRYKDTEFNNRQRVMAGYAEKKTHEANEIHRLQGENTRLEQEIHALEKIAEER